MSDGQKIGATDQELNISILQWYKYEKNIENYKLIEVPKDVRCYAIEFCHSVSIEGK